MYIHLHWPYTQLLERMYVCIDVLDACMYVDVLMYVSV